MAGSCREREPIAKSQPQLWPNKKVTKDNLKKSCISKANQALKNSGVDTTRRYPEQFHAIPRHTIKVFCLNVSLLQCYLEIVLFLFNFELCMKTKPNFLMFLAIFLCLFFNILNSGCKKVEPLRQQISESNTWSKSNCLVNNNPWNDCYLYSLTGAKITGTAAYWPINSQHIPALEVYLSNDCDSTFTEITLVINNFVDTGTYIIDNFHRASYSITYPDQWLQPIVFNTDKNYKGSVSIEDP